MSQENTSGGTRDAAGDRTQSGQSNTAAEEHREREPTPAGRVTAWFTETLARTAVAVLGLVLVLLAVGALVGVPILDSVVDFLTSSAGRWTLVALLGLALILAATRRWHISEE